LEWISLSAVQARKRSGKFLHDIRDQEIRMKRNWLSVILAGAVALLVPSRSLSAHHGGASYDREHPITVTGVVTEFQFINPHSRILIDVKNTQGAIEKWAVESGPPERLFRAGWRTDSLKPGDQVTVNGFPAKDGSKVLGLRQLTTSNGTVLTPGNE
jgi:uncharacterized protein DUF6152